MRFREGFRKGFREGQGNSSPLHTYSTTTPHLRDVVPIHLQTVPALEKRMAVADAPASDGGGIGVLDPTPTDDDLDMLDDSHRHARCCICTGTRGDLIGVPYVAICGRRAINLRPWNDDSSFPPDACPDCVRLYDQPCPRCGA